MHRKKRPTPSRQDAYLKRLMTVYSEVKVHILNMGLVEDTNIGRLILTIMLAFAEYERGMIVERTQTGKAIAKQNPGFKEGRPKKFSEKQIRHAVSLLRQGFSYKEVSAITGISKSTLIRNKS